MNGGEIKFGGIVLAIFAGILIFWKVSTDLWAALGIWMFIVPALIAAAAFYIWQRSTRRSEHPWQ
jgi:hypothetical protein